MNIISLKKYNLMFLAMLFSFLLAVCIFNYFVDPYWIYQTARIEGVNKNKPVFEKHIRLSRAHVVNKLKPSGIILGTSRAEFGIDPNHSGWETNNVYNSSIPAATLYELMRYFEHAIAIGSLSQAVISLDFLIFNIEVPNGKDLIEDRLNVSSDGSINYFASYVDIPRTLLSIDAIIASYTTLAGQHLDSMWLENGQRNWHYNAKNIIEKGGHRNAFLSVEEVYLNSAWFPEPCEAYRFTDSQSGRSTWNYYSKILALAHKNKIDLRIVLSPSHARLWENMDAVGLWNKFEIWKTNLVKLNELVAEEYKSNPFPLWDFAVYHELTSEQVPEIDDKSKMKWYWESSHYKPELGSIMLDRVFLNSNDSLFFDFGTKLNSNILNSHLAKIREKQSLI